MHLVPTQDEVVQPAAPHRRDPRRTLRISQRTARHRIHAGATGHALLPARQGAERGLEPAAARECGNSRHDSGAFHRLARHRRIAGGVRRMRSAARASGVLGGSQGGRRCHAIPPVSGTEARREGAAGGRHPAIGPQSGGIEAAGGIHRRRSGRDGRDYLSAHAEDGGFQSRCRFTTWHKLDATYYKDAGSCEMCKRGVPAEKVWI